MATLTLRILSNTGDITKGSTLTSSELDQNLISLNNELATKFTKTGDSIDGNLDFTGTGRKITGDFSNATQSNRTAIQSNVTNGVTGVNIIPNGTATDTAIRAFNASDVTNGSYTDIATSATTSMLRAGILGTGTYLPLVISVGGSSQVSISTTGTVSGSTTGYFSSPYTPSSFAYANQHTVTSPYYSTISMTGSAYYPMVKSQVTGSTQTVNFSIGPLHNADNTIDLAFHRINSGGTFSNTFFRIAENGPAAHLAAHLYPTATNTYDLGSTTVRWRNIYTQDLHLSNGIGDYTVVEGVENLYLVNNKTNKSFKFALIEVDPAEVPAKSQVA